MKFFKLSQLVILTKKLQEHCGYDLESDLRTQDFNMKRALKVIYIQFNLFKINS